MTFGKWEDRSPPADTLNFLSVLLLTRLETTKEIIYSRRADSAFREQKNKFIMYNNNDKEYDFHFTEKIPYADTHCLIYNAESGNQPWFSHCYLLILMDVLLIGWIMRIKLNASTKVVKYRLEKYIHY